MFFYFFLDLGKTVFPRSQVSSIGAFSPCVGSCGLLWDLLAHLQVSQQPWMRVVAGQRDLTGTRALGSGYKWFLPTRRLNSLSRFFTWKDKSYFLELTFHVYMKGENNSNSMETGMVFWGWPSYQPVASSSLWPHLPVSITGIITEAPAKVNVLVWGSVWSNKKKRTGCPGPATEEVAQMVLSPTPGAEAAVTVPKSYFFQKLSSYICIQMLQSL